MLVATDCHIKLYNKKFVYTFEIIQTAFVILGTTMQTQNTYTHSPAPENRDDMVETWQTFKTSATEFSGRSGSFDGEGCRHDRPVGPLATLRRIRQGSTKNSFVTSGPVCGMATRDTQGQQKFDGAVEKTRPTDVNAGGAVGQLVRRLKKNGAASDLLVSQQSDEGERLALKSKERAQDPI